MLLACLKSSQFYVNHKIKIQTSSPLSDQAYLPPMLYRSSHTDLLCVFKCTQLFPASDLGLSHSFSLKSTLVLFFKIFINVLLLRTLCGHSIWKKHLPMELPPSYPSNRATISTVSLLALFTVLFSLCLSEHNPHRDRVLTCSLLSPALWTQWKSKNCSCNEWLNKMVLTYSHTLPNSSPPFSFIVIIYFDSLQF